MSDRSEQIEAFLRHAGWATARRHPIKGDASTRSYTRLEQADQTVILMNAPKGDEAPAEPDNATVSMREALGYNALARLAGPNLEAFLSIANQLKRRGFSAPRVLAADVDHGFALLEDFGAQDVWTVLRDKPDQERLIYDAAIETLGAIYRSSFPTSFEHNDVSWRVRDYDDAARLAEVDLLLDYYAPDAGRMISKADRVVFHDLWREAFQSLNAHPSGLCLRDFHAQNLFWLPDREYEARVGLIDFQDALFAHPAYDLVSVLEDARRDVAPDLVEPMMMRFCDKAGLDFDDAFKAAYAVTAAQRNAKILGIFVRLAVRDNKPQYRDLIPRVQAHFKTDLSHPVCADLRAWFGHHLPEVLQ